MGPSSQRIEIEDTPRHIRPKRKRRRRTGWMFSLMGIVLVLGGGAYFVHKDWEPDADANVSSMSVSYRCPKCSNSFQLTVAQAGQMRRERGDIACPACGALGAEKQDVEVVISGEETPADPASIDAANSEESGKKPQPTMTRRLDNP